MTWKRKLVRKLGPKRTMQLLKRWTQIKSALRKGWGIGNERWHIEFQPWYGLFRFRSNAWHLHIMDWRNRFLGYTAVPGLLIFDLGPLGKFVWDQSKADPRPRCPFCGKRAPVVTDAETGRKVLGFHDPRGILGQLLDAGFFIRLTPNCPGIGHEVDE